MSHVVKMFRPKEMIFLGLLLILAVIGIVAWIYQLMQGLIVTNMRNIFPWGLYIATFAFLVGTAAGGLIVSSSIYLFNVRELKPIAPLASLTAFVFVLGAMAMVIPDLGRPERILNILLYPNFSSLLVWDFIVLTAYAILSLAHVYIGWRPYAARLRGLSEDKIAELETKSFRWGRILAPISLPFAVLIHTVTAWIFAVNAGRPWWFGGFLAPSFLAAALVSGSAVVILASIAIYGFKEDLRHTYNIMMKFLATSVAVLLFLVYQDYFVRWWWGGDEGQILSILFNKLWLTTLIGEFALLFTTIIIAIKLKTSLGAVLSAVLALLGVYAHRFNLMEPSYNVLINKILLPSSETTIPVPIVLGDMKHSYWLLTFWPYTPSPIEIMITIGWLSGIMLILYVLAKLLFSRR